MLKINKQSITLTKGDDASLRLVPRYKDKTIYTVQEGDSAIFRLKVGASVKELECVINLENNKIVVNFTPADTKDFEPGIYRYEAELITSLGFHYTFIADQPFILGNEIEQRLSNATSANGNSNGNYPEIDGEIGDEPIVNGDIQPTNPMMDYDELNHLPKLNGKTIKGDKDNAYYGIPTKTSDLDNDSDFVSDDDYVHTDNNYDDTDKDKVDSLGTASTYDVAESGNASTSQVVKGDDTRLTDARTPVAHQHSKVDITDFPTNVSAFNNDSGYITNAVNTLINYYLKSETYTKTEVEQLIAAIKQGKFEVVETLPANPDPNVIYLVPKDPTQTSNAYDEYVYINNAWEKIGDTDIDLSDYVTDEELTTALQNYVTTSAFQTAIANYYTKTETDNLLGNKVDKVAGKGLSTNDYDNTAKGIVDGVTSALNDKVDKVQGKGLSTNDYDNTAKGIVDGVTSALADKVDKVNGKGLSTEDYTTAEKSKLGGISDNAKKVASSSTNGHIEIDDVDTVVYDDTDIQNAIDEIDDIITTDESTIEGNPINFTTLSAQKSKSTILSLEPIQDLHGYDKPWVGGAGKNILKDGETSPISNTGFIATMNSDGSWTIGGGNTSSFFAAIYSNLPINLPAGTYTFSTSCSSGAVINGLQVWMYTTIDGEAGVSRLAIPASVTITASSSFSITNMAFWHDTENKSFSGKVFMQLEKASSPTVWNPYTNLCPITGRTEIGILGCGRNRYQMRATNASKNGVNVVANSDGTVNISGTASGGSASISLCENASELTNLFAEGGNYTLSLNKGTYSSTTLNVSLAYKKPNDSGTYFLIPGHTDAIPANSTFISSNLYVDNGNSVQALNNFAIQLEKASTATDYAPYTKSNDLTISLGQTAYGCHYSVENGELVADRVLNEFDGSEDEDWHIVSGTSKFYIESFPNLDLSKDIITNKYPFSGVAISGSASVLIDKSCYIQNVTRVWVYDSDYADISALKAELAINKLQVCYFLTTPITIQLTPNEISLLEGVNNISTTADGIKLTYRDGKVATLADLTSAVVSLDSKIDENKILTDTATGDKYILVVTNGVLSVQQISN